MHVNFLKKIRFYKSHYAMELIFINRLRRSHLLAALT